MWWVCEMLAGKYLQGGNMSWIWNVMLSFSDEEYWEDEEEALEIPRALENINAWLEADEVRNYGPLTDLTFGSGSAGMNANVFGGGFKHFDIDAFIEIVTQQNWQDRENVQLFVQGEDAGHWTILDFSKKSP